MLKWLFNVPPSEESIFYSVLVTIGLSILLILLLWLWPELFFSQALN